MANTYTQISIHAIFAVKNRENFITKDWRYDLHSYISGTISNIGSKPLAVGGWKDHVHLFFGLNPTIAISEFIKVIKSNSSKWINEQGFLKGRFQWQESYAAFSYSKSQRNSVIRYIMNQEQHHATKTFKEEYIETLKKFDVEYDDRYLIEFYD